MTSSRRIFGNMYNTEMGTVFRLLIVDFSKIFFGDMELTKVSTIGIRELQHFDLVVVLANKRINIDESAGIKSTSIRL